VALSRRVGFRSLEWLCIFQRHQQQRLCCTMCLLPLLVRFTKLLLLLLSTAAATAAVTAAAAACQVTTGWTGLACRCITLEHHGHGEQTKCQRRTSSTTRYAMSCCFVIKTDVAIDSAIDGSACWLLHLRSVPVFAAYMCVCSIHSCRICRC
jgi:hypothetical protein